jgi:hypothetical protein
MWLYMIGGALLLIGIVGGVATGGAVTLALIPIGAVVLLSAGGYAMWQRAAEGSAGADTDAHPSTGEPLPHSRPHGTPGHVPTSPEALTDARRAEQ